MLDYYKLFDYCKKISEDNNLKKERQKKNREAKQKKQLFRIITENAYYNIKNSADEGKDFAIIYDSEYNKLIEELMESLVHHFKPFNVIYKKKCFGERGIFEILKDETNYILIIDWNISKSNKMNNNEINHNSEIEYNNEIEHNNEIKHNNDIEDNIVNNKIDIIIESNDNNNKTKKDTFLDKLGFEAIF